MSFDYATIMQGRVHYRKCSR